MDPSQVPILIVFAATILAFGLGIYFGNSLRMKDHAWKIALILSSIALFGTITYFYWPPALGIDLSGGVILVYEVDEEETATEAERRGADSGDVDMDALVDAISQRLNPSGVKDIVVRKYGPKQVEVIVPQVSEKEIDFIKRAIVEQGFLKFRMVATQSKNPDVWQAGRSALESTDPEERASRYVMGPTGQRIGEWVEVGREEGTKEELGKLRVELHPSLLYRELEPGHVEVLMALGDSRFNVDGQHLASVSAGFDQEGRNSINFRMKPTGAKLFGKLTNEYAPDSQTGQKFQLGIVMDNRLISAPQINERISESGVITGNFTDEETEFLVNVLQAGRLPAVLKKEPISENSISPLLGMDTIRKGATAISISLVAVLSFMAIYYRFSGLIACAALLLNLLLTVGTMILINGAFTLPGLAGLVLTVGISVDNNVLIFERMREELKRGAALRMAIRNGFGRATTTIVDANVTSIITAAVLYYVGNDQIKGFAVTMLLGIVMSMFTAVFCARVVYDIAERKRWITNLNMMQFIGDSHYNFIGLVRPAVTASLVLIGIGLIAVLIRGRQLFDIDFNGGSSVTAMLTQPMTAEEVRAKTSEFDQHATVTEVRTEGRDIRTVWRIDTEDKDVVDLQKKLSATFTDAGTKKSLLVARNFSFDPPVAVAGSEATSNAATAGGASTTNANGAAGEVNATDFNDGSGRGTSLESSGNPADVIPADGDQSLWTRPPASPGNRGGVLLAQADTTLRLAQADTATDVTASSDAEASDAGNAQPAAVPSTNEVVTPTSETTASDLDTGGSAPVTPRQGVEYQSKSVLKFANEPISKRALLDGIVDAAGRINVNVPSMQFSNPKWTGRDENETFSEWTVSFTTTPEQTEKILSELKSEMDSTPAWLSSNRIGAKVASDMREMAVAAIVFCLIGIVLYIWVRFQRVAFGLAAVVALIHDVLIALGGVALSLWLAKVFGFLLVDEFKISLPVVAAFLTLIGYSLNDTIVVFDRIREVRGKSPDLTPQMINDSVNQTLSRTLLTSGTTMIVIIILYIGGGQGIHSFAFSLLIGLIVGTYSSIFIASPVLLWLMKRTMASAGAKKKVTVSR